MKQHRQGTNLRIQIRMTLLSLGRDPHQYDSQRLSLDELKKINRKLLQEYKQSA
jgi:hypothetical protein